MKWSGEVGDLLLARGLCSFEFLLVALVEEGVRERKRERDKEIERRKRGRREKDEVTASQYKYA